MNEECFDKQEADELTVRIADRLGERQQKLERMVEWERKATATNVRPMYWVGAVAACVAVVVMMMPFWGTDSSPLDELGIGAPTMTEFRAATPEASEIMRLIEQNDFEAAIAKTEAALDKSEKELKELERLTVGWDDEEMNYQLEQETVVNGELRWTYIYLLVKTDRKKEAKKQLKYYIRHHSKSENIEEARALLKAL